MWLGKIAEYASAFVNLSGQLRALLMATEGWRPDHVSVSFFTKFIACQCRHGTKFLFELTDGQLNVVRKDQMDQASHRALTAEQNRGYPKVTSNKSSEGNEGNSSNSTAVAPRAQQRVQTTDPCGILERFIQKITDGIWKEAGTAFRRYRIIGSITALCKDPVKWFSDQKNKDELSFRLENLGDISSLIPEMEKIASSYASISLMEKIFDKPSNAAGASEKNAIVNVGAGKNEAAEDDAFVEGYSISEGDPNIKDDAVAADIINADGKKLTYDDFLGEFKKAFLQKPGLQRMIDRTFEDVFPGYANAVNLDAVNRKKAFVTIPGSVDFDGKIFKIETNLEKIKSFFQESEWSESQENISEIIAQKLSNAPANVAKYLRQLDRGPIKTFSGHVEAEKPVSSASRIFRYALDTATKSIQTRQSEKRGQVGSTTSVKKIKAEPGKKVKANPETKVKASPETKVKASPDKKASATLGEECNTIPAILYTSADEFIRNMIEPAIVDLASDKLPFNQELQIAYNFFHAINIVISRCSEDKLPFYISLVESKFHDILGKSERHISTFAFQRAAAKFRDEKHNGTVDRSALVEKFINSSIFPGEDGPKGRLSILVQYHIKNFLGAWEKLTIQGENADEIDKLSVVNKLVRSLKTLKEPLDAVERISFTEVINENFRKFSSTLTPLENEIREGIEEPIEKI